MENLEGGDILLTETEISEINDAIARHDVKGDRYFGKPEAEYLWG